LPVAFLPKYGKMKASVAKQFAQKHTKKEKKHDVTLEEIPVSAALCCFGASHGAHFRRCTGRKDL
jgi:hypothetical protein